MKKSEKAIEVLVRDSIVDDSVVDDSVVDDRVVDSRSEGGIARKGEGRFGVWWEFVRSWVLRL